MEDDPALLEIARAVLSTKAPGVTLVAGPLAGGCSANAPYDMILIEGAVPAVPPALVTQLHPETGRLLTAICGEGRTTRAILAEVSAGRLGISTIFDAGTPPIPSLRQAPSFRVLRRSPTECWTIQVDPLDDSCFEKWDLGD